MRIVVDTANPFGPDIDEKIQRLIAGLTKTKFSLVILDRGNLLLSERAERFWFPSYSAKRFNADDSKLIQMACDYLEAGIYISALPTPLRVPSVLLFSEKHTSHEDLGRISREIELAASYAEAILLDAGDEEKIRKLLTANQKKIVYDLEDYLRSRSRSALIKDQAFYVEWSRLRILQAEVDAVVWSD